MMTFELANSWWMYLMAAIVCLFVLIGSAAFIWKSYKDAAAIGMDKSVLRKTVFSSALFTLIPSISILIGVIALSGIIGVPLPWIRLSVIGALHYETQVAAGAAEAIGLSGLNISEMTEQAFTTIALLMGFCICWGMVLSVFFNKKYMIC